VRPHSPGPGGGGYSENERDGVTNGNIDEWIGKQVGVRFVGSVEGPGGKQQETGGGTLESVDERGIVLSYHDATDLSQMYWFFPWHKIEWIHLLTT